MTLNRKRPDPQTLPALVIVFIGIHIFLCGDGFVTYSFFDVITRMVNTFSKLQLLTVSFGLFKSLELSRNTPFAEIANFLRLFG